MIWLLLACAGEVRTVVVDADADGDGWSTLEGDCADDDTARHPAAPELCNAIDDDCDGLLDTEDTNLAAWAWTDADGDGAPGTWARSCGTGEREDCDDADPLRSPYLDEIACDGVDGDCDGNGDGPAAASLSSHEYPSVEEALDAAVSGDTLLVCAGTWAVNLTVPAGLDDLTIASASGSAADTILDGGGQRPVVDYAARGLALDGLTLQNGAGRPGALGDSAGGGVYCARSADADCSLSASGCVFRDNVAELGSAIALTESPALELRDTRFEGNVASVAAAVLVTGAYDADLIAELTDVWIGPDQGGPDQAGWGSGSAVLIAAQPGDHDVIARLERVTLSGQAFSRDGALRVAGYGKVELEVLGGELADNDVAIGLDASLDAADLHVEGARIVRNGAQGGPAVSASERARIGSVQSDWGEGPDDNLGPDLWFADVGYRFGADATFVCEPWGACE